METAKFEKEYHLRPKRAAKSLGTTKTNTNK